MSNVQREQRHKREETHQSDMFETQIAFVAKVVRCVRFADDYHVLDPDAVSTVRVVPRFCVGDCREHACHDIHMEACHWDEPLDTVMPGLRGVLL